ALEYVDGGTLTEQFQAPATAPTGATTVDDAVSVARLATKAAHAPFPPRRAAELVEALARAVQHLHERGVVHGAVHPSRARLTAAGVSKRPGSAPPRLAARPADAAPPPAPPWAPPYSPAPEQLAGAPAAPAADLYGLGTVLYKLPAGAPPFL